MREFIYREILEYHPHMLADYLAGTRPQLSYMYPSAVDNFKRQFAHLESSAAAGQDPNARQGQRSSQSQKNLGQATSLPRERVKEFQSEAQMYMQHQHPGHPHAAAVIPEGSHVSADPAWASSRQGIVDSMASGVRNMSVGENGYRGGVPHPGMANGMADPRMQRQYPGYPVHMQQQHQQAQPQHQLLRSNSFQ